VGHGATHPAGSDAEELGASEGKLEGDVGAGARVVRELVLLVHVEVDQLFLQRRDETNRLPTERKMHLETAAAESAQ
jgi:hypothetical protein